MNPIRMTMAAIALAVTAFPASADKLSLGAISAYLNRLETARAKFTQINGDGTISTGTIFLRRPGRARFEYNPPADALVVVGGSQVAGFDILAKTVNLGQAKMVVAHKYDGTATTVTAQDPKHPEFGTIELKFTDKPTELRQWIIRDSSGKTTVVLGEMKTGISLRSSLFSITAAIKQRSR